MKLPKRIYVRWREGDDKPFLDVAETTEELAPEPGYTETCGAYELVETGELRTAVLFGPTKKPSP